MPRAHAGRDCPLPAAARCRYMCKKHVLNNESEWGLLEMWDHPGIVNNMSERKLPGDELLMDQTILAWERAARKKFGIVSVVPQSAFKLMMRKVSSLMPQARTKKEQHLEFCQVPALSLAWLLLAATVRYGL